MREDTIVEQATAKEITHEDVEMVRQFGAEFRRDESYVSALSLMALVFELPLSDVTVVDGEKAVLECRVGHACRRCHVVRRQRRDPPDHFHGRRLVSPIEHESLTTLETRRTVPLQHACSDIFVSFRHRTLSESKLVTFTSLMSCRHACNVKYIWTVCQFS